MLTRLLLQIAECNRQSVSQSGDLSPEELAAILELAIDTAPDRHAMMRALAEFIGSAVDGNVVFPQPKLPS